MELAKIDQDTFDFANSMMLSMRSAVATRKGHSMTSDRCHFKVRITKLLGMRTNVAKKVGIVMYVYGSTASLLL